MSSTPPGTCLQTRVAAYAQALPDKTAVEWGDAQLSYGELNSSADGLAFHLQARGAGPEVLVAVLLDRTPHLLTAILAVLKTGSSYLPIDTQTPIDRVRFMVEDSLAAILITERSIPLPSGIGRVTQVIYLDDVTPDGSDSGQPAFAQYDDAARLAYVIYTSGSTGQPKGVEIVHEGLNRFFAHMQRELKFTSRDTMLALASLSFDVAVFELLFPLYCGGRVVILPRSVAADGRNLAAAINRYRASVVLATPATWQILVDSGWAGAPHLRAVSGGEAMAPALAHFLLEKTAELWNHYGPTEATIAASSYRVRGGEDKIPIGTAIAGLSLYVLNSAGKPVAQGEPGELFITGRGLARGYRRHPELTAQRFSHLEFGDTRVRAYRTGDLVRYNRDGHLEFVGRVDNQIKIRGYRVELEEIEAALSRHPHIREAAVIAHDQGADDRRLVAWIAPSEGVQISASELRRFLGGSLSSYMIPGEFLFAPALPKTANGKLDRQALVARTSREIAPSKPSETPDDPLEMRLLEIWRRIPRFGSIGTTDSFFDFGGHSLLAVKLMRDIEQRLGASLPLSALFEARTVAALAAFIRSGAHYRPWSPLVAIRETGSRPPLFCVHGIGGNVLNFERLGVYLDSDQPIYGLQAHGLISGMPLRTVEEMAVSYVEAIKKIQPAGPYLISGHSAGGLVAFEMARHLRAADEEVALLVLFDALMYATPETNLPQQTFAERIRRKYRNFVRRAKAFRGLKPLQRQDAIRRKVTYNWWLVGIKTRTKSYLLFERLGFKLPPPTSMPDAFALAVQNYRAGYFDGTAVLYRAARGDGDADLKPAMGWDEVVRDLSVEVSQADHHGMFYEPHVRTLAESLDRHVVKALQARVPQRR